MAAVAVAVATLAIVPGAVASGATPSDQAAGTADVVSRAPVVVDGTSDGRMYDGMGAVSGGGATSRLLLDYPAEQRNQVLDYLFKPGYGASLQLLKVEIGGDTNTTDGSESSHEHARGQVDCEAGYEWWLMGQAVKRNPDIKLGGLAWGAPGWLDAYYSQDSIQYFISWLDCAKQHHLTIDNMGVRNERDYDTTWIKQFRSALDLAGYGNVRIIASDEAAVKGEWPIAVDMANDPDLDAAVGLLGNHYSTGPSSATAQSLEKPLWISEGGPWTAEWGAGGDAKSIPALLNHAYLSGRITGVEIWNLLTSYYEGLSISDAGLMRANTPWSGAYQVQSAIWAMAQTTQFASPGWQYLDDSSGYLDADDHTQGSYVSLRSPSTGDWSTVYETIGTSSAQQVDISVKGGLTAGRLHVWQTTADEQFEQQPDLVRRADGTYRLTIPANAVVSITTTTGQGKGTAHGEATSGFPFPYSSTLADGGASGQTTYFSQMEGAYEERPCQGDRTGTCLTQVAPTQPISWAAWNQPAGIIGDMDWADYQVAVDTYVPASGTGEVLGRISDDAMQPVPNGYGITLSADGSWSLGKGAVGGRSWVSLQDGTLGAGGTGWHRLQLTFRGDQVTATIDGTQVASVADDTWQTGMAGLSGSYSPTQFANLAIGPVGSLSRVDDADGSAVETTGTGWRACDASRPARSCGTADATLADAYRGTLTASKHAGDALTLHFTGTQGTLVGVDGPDAGTAEVSVDGNAPQTVSLAASTTKRKAVWRTPVLTDGDHTVTVTVTRAKGSPAGWVAVDALKVAPDAAGPSSVDDQATGTGLGRLDYSGPGWTSCPGCIGRTGLYHASVTTTSTVGDSVAFRFEGTSVDLYGLRASNEGIADVRVDGALVGQADFYGKTRVGGQLIWTSPQLSSGTHELTLTATGTGNPSASGTEINVDRFAVHQDSGPEIEKVSVAEGATVSGKVSFQVDLGGDAKDVSYTYVELNKGAGQAWVTDNTKAPGSTNAGLHPTLVVDTTTLANGAYGLKVDAVGTNGKTTEKKVSFTVNNPPRLVFVTPADGATVSGKVPVTVDLEGQGLQAYNLRVDAAGLSYAYQPKSGDQGFTWDTTTVADGVHTLLATATDGAGNKTTVTVKVTVANTPAS